MTRIGISNNQSCYGQTADCVNGKLVKNIYKTEIQFLRKKQLCRLTMTFISTITLSRQKSIRLKNSIRLNVSIRPNVEEKIIGKKA